MKMTGSKIETLFHEKILLYRDLLDVLKQEAESITAINVEACPKKACEPANRRKTTIGIARILIPAEINPRYIANWSGK